MLRRVAQHNDTWAISQTVQEFMRLEATLALYNADTYDVTLDDVRLRLDIMISRMLTMREGTIKLFMGEMPTRERTMNTLFAVVTDLDTSLNGSETPDLAPILARMHELERPLTTLSAQSVQLSWARVEKNLVALERIHRISGIVVTILIMCWCGLLLILQNHNRLLKLAHKRGKILNNSLNEAGEELRNKNRSLHYAAHHDSLTALPNRVLFWGELETALQTPDCSVSLLLLDLDEFKTINDTMGHDFGDVLLHQVSERMRRFDVKPQMFCRLGGDEFACLLLGKTAEDSQAYAHDLAIDIAAPYQLSDRRVEIGCSIGLVNVPTPSVDDAQELFKRADIALYRAKASRSDRICVFEPFMQGEFDDRTLLESDLRKAIGQGEIEVAYQVQVCVRTDELRGIEALARWNHPTRGHISPNIFIPIAEDIGLIRELGQHILTKACAEAVTWATPLKIAVNLSTMQMQSPEFISVVSEAIRVTGLKPNRLELEVTESMLLDKREDIVIALNDLRRFGITIALDDFGTGYSSLAVLRDIPFDTIKLDKSFIRDIGHDKEAEALVKLVIDLGQTMNKFIIIEGVETVEQKEIIRKLGGHIAQGYLFGHPVPATELAHLR